jgi:hypothetical protein
MATLETDYLVVGAGATGLAFTDELVARTDADVILVDRRTRPGGHWNDAYPFVRLHQPSAYYGVNSRRLGDDRIDTEGPNAGFYERATGAEICAYFQAVLEEQLLPSGRVRFLGGHEHQPNSSGPYRVRSSDSGEEHEIVVRRKLVDATYLETPIPATHTPPFAVEHGVRVVPVNALGNLDDHAERYVVIGGGKTAMDACGSLLDHGVDPARIQWIRPRDSWTFDRATFQPLERVASVMEAISHDLEAAARAETLDDVFEHLERCGRLLRLDDQVRPTMFRCAILSRGEAEQLRRITDVVRLGRVVRIGLDEITLVGGSIPTSREHLHVDCTAAGLRVAPARPIFEPDRITLQQVQYCSPTFNAALVAYVEATRRSLDEKNALCPPNPYPDSVEDWVPNVLITMHAVNGWIADPEVSAWLEQSRLYLARGALGRTDEPRMQEALQRYAANLGPALATLERFRDEIAAARHQGTAEATVT